MDEQQRHIQEDLQELIQGELRFDPLSLALYATDGSLYQVRPLGVVLPRHRDDVATVLQYAAEHDLPIIARGAGSGVAGESLGSGLILDFSRYMRRIVSIDEESVRVQPGVVCDRLNAHLSRTGRQFAPDPAGAAYTTVGSMAAINAAGSHSLRYGATRDHLASIEAVLVGGHVMEFGPEPVAPPRHVGDVRKSRKARPGQFPDVLEAWHPTELPAVPGGSIAARRRDLVVQVATLLRQHGELIQRSRPRAPRNDLGYLLDGVLSNGDVNLAKLLAGSEGTLAVFTELTLKTVPLPAHRGVALLLFHQLEAAAHAVLEVLDELPSACDLLDRRLLSLARESDLALDVLIPGEAEAALLVEVEGIRQREVREHLRRITHRVCRRTRLAFHAHEAYDPELIERFWQLPRTVVPLLYRMKGALRPLPFVEDMAVPPDQLPTFLVRMQNILKRHQVTASLFAHAGDGQLHCRPFLDINRHDDVTRMRELADELYEQVLNVRGSISGEHGDGLVRTSFVRRQFPELFPVFREIKRLFDPHNLLNPGKIISDDPDLMVRNLRPTQSAGVTLVPLRLQWDQTQVADMTRRCNGCGGCRTENPLQRMCPIFRIDPSEEATPRAKANLVRHLFDGTLDPAMWESDQLKAVADLCVNCKQCRSECPAAVDVSKLMLEAKAAHIAANGMARTDWILSRADAAAALGSMAAPAANWMMQNQFARWLLEKVSGIARRRKMPRFAARPFLARAARRRWTRRCPTSGPRVAYLVDTYANYCDPQLAEAMVRVFEHNGVAVYVPPEQRGAGMPLVTTGDVDAAARIARHNVGVFADLVREGYTIVCTEPAAVLCLTEEYANLIDESDVQLVARHTTEACHYLWKRHLEGQLRLDFSPLALTAGYHTPCHLKALQIGTPGQNLLQLVPQLRAPTIERGCSGMAGIFGIKQRNYRTSLRAGWGLLSRMREDDLACGTTECSTCKMQMEQGTEKPTLHPLKLLALAYGLMPEVRHNLDARSKPLVVT